MHASRDLDRLLRSVSRSFYLTLRVAPRPLRRQLAVAYLFCRAADTIADTRLLPPAERLEHLDLFREQFARDEASGEALRRIARRLGEPGAIPQERELLERLAEWSSATVRLQGCLVLIGGGPILRQAGARTAGWSGNQSGVIEGTCFDAPPLPRF